MTTSKNKYALGNLIDKAGFVFKKTSLHFLLILTLVVSVACNNAQSKRILNIPKSIQSFERNEARRDLEYTNRRNVTPLKIYTLINAYCACSVEDIKDCNKLSLELKPFKHVAVVPICYSHDNFELLRFQFESGAFTNDTLPLFIDSSGQFIKENATLINSAGRLTVLTNSRNQILAIGDPFQNNHDKKQFLKIIKDFTIAE